MKVGYERVRQSLGLSALPPWRVAQVMPVARVSEATGVLSIPASVAPDSSSILANILFALKHEGTDLQILAEALPLVPEQEMRRALHASPNGAYVRVACYLWEHFTNREIDNAPGVGGANVDLFDAEQYITGPRQRNAKWRVNFNGLGSLDYCPTVRKTPVITSAIERDVLSRANDFARRLGPVLLDRALAWAYLGETEHSFAIERVAPTDGRAQRFVQLLRQAHDGAPVDEEYLVRLQNEALNNSFEHDFGFRERQNWLSGAGRGAPSVVYVPPPPRLVPSLMRGLMSIANAVGEEIDPVVRASLVSFGFVFIHPFMDGNGRLSRFLFHKTLCLSGRLKGGLILPVSIAMSRREADYLATLKAYSDPMRRAWEVRWADADSFDFNFHGADSLYRYWDATRCVEFGFEMAELALDAELRHETEFLQRYDRVYASLNERFDVRGSTLSKLIVMCLDNDGRVSNHRRKQFVGQVPDAFFDDLEKLALEDIAARAAADEIGPRDPASAVVPHENDPEALPPRISDPRM